MPIRIGRLYGAHSLAGVKMATFLFLILRSTCFFLSCISIPLFFHPSESAGQPLRTIQPTFYLDVLLIYFNGAQELYFSLPAQRF